MPSILSCFDKGWLGMREAALMFWTRVPRTLLINSFVTGWLRSRFITASWRYLNKSGIWNKKSNLYKNARVGMKLCINQTATHFSFKSVLEPSSLDSCWMSERRMGWPSGHGVTLNIKLGSVVSHTNTTKSKFDAFNAWIEIGFLVLKDLSKNRFV